MATLKVLYVAPAFATTTGVSFEGTVPGGVGLDIADHIICLIVPSKTVPAILFTKEVMIRFITCKEILCNFCSIQILVLSFCINDKKQFGI